MGGFEEMCMLHAVVVLWFGTKRVSCLGVFREKSVEGLEGAAQRFIRDL